MRCRRGIRKQLQDEVHYYRYFKSRPTNCAGEQQRKPAASANEMEAAAEVILEFLQSKCLLSAERALRTELELVLQREDALLARNLWTSRLEELLNTELPRRVESEPPEIEDLTPLEAVASQLDPGEGNLAAGTLPHARERVERARQAAGAERRKRLTLFELVPLGADESARLQRQRGHGSARGTCAPQGSTK